MITGEVYTLTHPVTKCVFYVGSTVNGVKERLSNHMACVNTLNYGIYTFIREEKIIPIIDVIETGEYEKRKCLTERERHYIEIFTKSGVYLYNRFLNPTKKVQNSGATIKIPIAVHKELKKYVACQDGDRIEDVAGLAIVEYLKSKGHKFDNAKKIKA